MLTKSLHTITAATNVAAHMLRTARPGFYSHGNGANNLAADALSVLGYETEAYAVANDRARDDAVIVRIVANCAKLLASSQGPRRGIYQADVHA